MYTAPDRNPFKNRRFKRLLARDYLQIPQGEYNHKLELTCQISGIEMFPFLIRGVYLFKRERVGDAVAILGMNRIDFTRNGLLM
jgi:hypothetical protein